MGIIGMVLTLGIWGMLVFRRTVEIQQSLDEVVAVVKEARSLAENNVLPKDIVPNILTNENGIYGYEISFENDNLVRRLCPYSTKKSKWETNSKVCEDAYELKSQTFQQILYDQRDDGCSTILFENLTGEIWVQKVSDLELVQNQTCTIMIRHRAYDTGRILEIDGENNTFQVLPN